MLEMRLHMLPWVGSKCCNWLLMGVVGEKHRKLV
jgi:hypothetical protein